MPELNQQAFDGKNFLATVTSKPGVYRMLDAKEEILYVGKAKNLKKRLASYFRPASQLSPKTRALVGQIATVEVTATHTETEALILENNLIKKHLPRYNILLRDDKSYPYIYLSDDCFPRLCAHRGAKRGKGRYFGPYPSAGSVRESLNLLQKIFPIRQCDNSFFKNRSRPCLQYQIKRCTAPCVGLIDKATYAGDVKHTALFLEGKSHTVIKNLVAKMEAAATKLAYEKAADYRDRIARLRHLQEHQYMESPGQNDTDIVACVTQDNAVCVQVLMVRGGRSLGSRAYFPKQAQNETAAAVLTAFLPQYYLARSRDIPAEIVVNHLPGEESALAEALSKQRGGKVQIHAKVRGTRAHWLKMAEENAKLSIKQRKPGRYREQVAALAAALQLEELPQRMECFDISHSSGEQTQASCVVFDQNGPRNSDYRRFNIKGITPGDDYAAMQQALARRFTFDKKELANAAPLPDILIVDGGKGQMAQARDVLRELQLTHIRLIGIAKGEGRKAQYDHLLVPGKNEALALAANSPALHAVQQIRDEAHRFALGGHRKQRAKSRRTSLLENISGIGAKRRQDLIKHFGGLQGVRRAGVEDLAAAPGINRKLAQKIYDLFHA